MLENLTAFFIDTIISNIENSGYLAVFILMTLESALVPIPSEITMPFAGFLVSQGKLNFWFIVTIGAVANLTGSLIAYWIGSWGQDRVHFLVRKYGKYLLISVDDVERAERWFRTHGELIAFGSRLLPVVRTFISLPAGIAKMNIKKFALYTFAGAFIWSAFLAYIGVVLGKNWHSLEPIFRRFQFVIVGLLVALIVWYFWHKIRKIRAQRD